METPMSCPHCKYGYAHSSKCPFCGGSGLATPASVSEAPELGFASDEEAQNQADTDMVGPRPLEHKARHARAGRSYSTEWWNR